MRTASGALHVFTFKEGMLAVAAHDLRIVLPRFEATLERQQLHATLDLRALSVEGPVTGTSVQPYDPARRAEVERAMQRDVLRTQQHPSARFDGVASPDTAGFRVSGTLELAGQRAPLAFEVRGDGGIYRASFELRPSQWGIAQYRALLGSIRVRDVVRIEFAVTEAGVA